MLLAIAFVGHHAPAAAPAAASVATPAGAPAAALAPAPAPALAAAPAAPVASEPTQKEGGVCLQRGYRAIVLSLRSLSSAQWLRFTKIIRTGGETAGLHPFDTSRSPIVTSIQRHPSAERRAGFLSLARLFPEHENPFTLRHIFFIGRS